MSENIDKVFTKCGRCVGRGHFTCYQNIAGGVCFECAGAKGFWETKETVKRRATAAERARKAEIKRREKRAALSEADALWTEFAMAYPFETQVILECSPDPTGRYMVGGWDVTGEDKRLCVAYSLVATYHRKDSQPETAVRIVREYAKDHGWL